MFDNLRDAFREAAANFKDELTRDQVPETVDQLLKNMQLGVIDVRSHIKRLTSDIDKATPVAERERQEAATCRRREAMANKIGDSETARVAANFARKHDERGEVLESKVSALTRERDLCKADLEEMMEKLRAAKVERERLAATAGRTQARSSIRDSRDLFEELDRMAEEVESEEHTADAYGEVEEETKLEEDSDSGFDFTAIDHEALAADRLKELKRRMGKE